MTVGERIRQRRIELGMTQDDLAKRVGFKSRSSINKIENSRELPLRKINNMAKALDIPPGILMGWSENDSASIGEISSDDLPKWTQQTDRLCSAQNVTRKLDASHAQNADEMELLEGYRVASPPVKKIMLDAAKDALKGDSDRLSDSTGEETA